MAFRLNTVQRGYLASVACVAVFLPIALYFGIEKIDSRMKKKQEKENREKARIELIEQRALHRLENIALDAEGRTGDFFNVSKFNRTITLMEGEQSRTSYIFSLQYEKEEVDEEE